MNTIDIDTRISFIMEKINHLSEKHPEFTCGKFPPQWEKPLSEKVISNYEKKHQITLPADYRRFITTIAGGGTQPFYGLFNPIKKSSNYEQTVIEKPFPFTVKHPLSIAEFSEEEYKAYEADEQDTNLGFLFLCHEGCGMYSILIVNSDDPDTYGTVWYYDLCNDVGIYPLIHPVTKKTMNFLDWLEYYVDRTLTLDDFDDFDFFSYGELAGIVS